MRQASRLAVRLSGHRISAIYTSPLQRAIETAKPLADRLHLTVRPCHALAELDYGAWQDQTFEDLEAQPEWVVFNQRKSVGRAPGGESLLDVQVRMLRCTERIRDTHPDETIAIVSHAEPIRVFVAHCLGIALDLVLRLEISPASVSSVQFSDPYCTIQCINCSEECP
jgi:probable phosphoglycerate mutase